MNIRNTKELKTFALERLEQAKDEKKIVFLYAGISMGLSVLVTLLQYFLSLEIGKTGGLSNMGTRSVLATIDTLLPVVAALITMCLSVGYLAAMLRVARGQYTSPQTLRLGFDRFWPLFRLNLLKMLICSGAAMVSLYAAIAIFLVTPLSRPVMELLAPLVSQVTVMDPTVLLDEALYSQLAAATWPVMVIIAVVFCVLVVPILFRYRMAEYILIDKPGKGALYALRESRKIMRGNCMNLLRLDFSMWWYYAGVLAVTVICYGDQILPLVGVNLPWQAATGYYVFYGVYQGLQLLLVCTLRNRVETSYALAYDTIRPREQSNGGVVLGNIFNL